MQGLVVSTDAVRQPLVAGGVFGLITGTILAFLVPTNLQITARHVILLLVIGLLGLGSLALFNQIVNGEWEFRGRGLVLYLLPFVITLTLAFLAAGLRRIARKP
ncbi:hypothetical protein MYX75_07005 [Acidobacteria bacterium AH-259-A15]|nr:hypothetical protein [Acidobacteria bacterium AH-259-A15]